MKIISKIVILTVITAFLYACGPKSGEIKPIRRSITETVFASGELVPDEQYDLTSLSDGYIAKLNFKEGDTVSPGSPLAVIDNKQNTVSSESAARLLAIAKGNTMPEAPDLKQAEANIEIAREKLNQDEVQEKRYRKLLETNSVSRVEYENAKLALDNSQANLKAMEENYKRLKQQADQQLVIQKSQSDINNLLSSYNVIKAVVGGKVYKKMKETGDYVRKGDIIAEIGSKNSLYAKLSIDENNISAIKIGQEVNIQLNVQPGKIYKGIITEIYPAFDDKTQSFYCKARFEGNPDFMVAGTQLQANVIIGRKENALVIPREYLNYGNKVSLKGKGEITVKTGFVSSEWVEIDSGLNESSVIIKP